MKDALNWRSAWAKIPGDTKIPLSASKPFVMLFSSSRNADPAQIMDLTLFIKGRDKTWSFRVQGTPEHLADWRADGLEVDELINTVPAWAPFRLWCWAQDVFRFRRPT